MPAIGSMDVALPQILAVAQARNSAVGVTGALLVCNGWFVQALEGPMKAVLETYGRVMKDPRHEGLKVIEATPTRERHFSEWSMCGLQLSPVDREIVETLESGGTFDPSRFSGEKAIGLLRAVAQMQGLRRGRTLVA
jgi:Sensors of blue-light using FAD